MVFSSETFLFLFLPAFLAAYYLTPNRFRSATILVGSYLFYGWWRFDFLALLFGTTLWTYVFGLLIERHEGKQRRLYCIIGTIGCLSVLGFFKYFNFLASTIAGVMGQAPETLTVWHVILPIGVSFYVFESISYLVDVYRRESLPARNFADFASFVALFPHLVAGPILRFRDLREQFAHRTHSLALFSQGMTTFIIGLAKKVLIADSVAPLADTIFAQTSPSLVEAWLGAGAYTIQLYFDFSGYSDMAIGLGLMMGFRLMENFNAPYVSRSITEFWRRWHISLSVWLRDYLYIPLGGNRKGVGRTYFNLFIVMVLGGLWHGANWTFVIWGAWHGLLLAIERYLDWPKRAPTVIWSLPLTLLCVVLGWVMFRAPDVGAAMTMYAGMFGLNGLGITPDVAWQLPREGLLVLIMAIGIAAIEPRLKKRFEPGLVIDGQGTAVLRSAWLPALAMSLLLAAQLRSNGQLADYGLDPRTAVTIAFGAILGGVDGELCSRIARIARNYESGEIVEQDYPLAERWLRLGADLGDATAAWKVARYHLTSERIVKDNDILLKYLAQAAEAQIPQAQVDLGEIYQDGSLLSQDLERAEALFASAAANGYRIGNMRLVALLEPRAEEPDVLVRLETALRDLSSFPDAPTTALVKLSALIIKKDGRWAARQEAQPLLERAVEQNNPEAALLLADMVLANGRDPGSIDRAISLLNLAISEGGKSEAMARLADIYMCMVPDAPNLELAARWRESARAAGNAGDLIIGADGAVSDSDLAQAQSMALRGSSASIAQYVEMLRQQDYGDEVLSFWQNRIEQNPTAQSALAKLLVESEMSGDGVQLSIDLLQNAVAAGSDAARVTLANLLLGELGDQPNAKAQAIALFEQAASHGSGAAIKGLLEHQADADPEAIIEQYRTAIDARGDLDALLFAAEHAGTPNDRLGYLALAANAARCNFTDVIKIGRGYARAANKPAAEQWLALATHLVTNQGWQYASLAEEFGLLKDTRHAPVVVRLLEEAVKHGQITSLDRLIDLRSDTQSSVYDPAKVVALVQQAVETATPSQLLNLARRIERARPDLRDQITQTVDIQAIYRTSAEGGNATAMRELAKYLQQRASGPLQLTEAMDWMEKAAVEQDPEAMLLLAKAYTVGLGREASLDKAVALLEAAADLGNTDAKTMLRAMGALQTQ